MAQYRVKEKSFVNNAIREAGEVIDIDLGQDADGKDIAYSKKTHANLEPVVAKAATGKGKAADAPVVEGGEELA